GRASSRDAKRRYVSAKADESLEDPVAVRKPADKVGDIIYPKHNGAKRAGSIVFCEGAARQEKPVIVAIACQVVTADRAFVIDASSLGKIAGIVRFDDRRAKVTIAEPDKTALHPERIHVN